MPDFKNNLTLKGVTVVSGSGTIGRIPQLSAASALVDSNLIGPASNLLTLAASSSGLTLTVPATGTAALLGTANVFTAAQAMPTNGLTVGTTQLAAVSGRIGIGKATAAERLAVHENSAGVPYLFGVHMDNDTTAFSLGLFNDTYSTTADGIAAYVSNAGGGFLKLGAGTGPTHRLHIISTGDDHLRLQYGTDPQLFRSFITDTGTWTFEKPSGNVATGDNAIFRFDTTGGIDAINPFWSGFQWRGHTVTDGGGSVFPILTMFSRSAIAADPTDYEFLFSAGNAGARPLGLSFAANNNANAFVRFGFGQSLDTEAFRAKYDGTNALVGINKTAPTALLHIGTTGSVGHLRMDGIAGNPASPTAGDHWYNTSQKSHRMQATSGTAGMVGLLKAQTSIQSGDTINTTAAETNFATNFAIPANALTVGKSIRVWASGVYGTLGSGTVTVQLKVKLGTTTILDSSAITTAISIAARVWTIDARLIVTAVGASGTIEAKGVFRIPTANTDVGFSSAAVGGDATVTIDTTAGQTLQVSAQHGASSASNTIKMRQFLVEVLD
jgi:hypothetical protein